VPTTVIDREATPTRRRTRTNVRPQPSVRRHAVGAGALHELAHGDSGFSGFVWRTQRRHQLTKTLPLRHFAQRQDRRSTETLAAMRAGNRNLQGTGRRGGHLVEQVLEGPLDGPVPSAVRKALPVRSVCVEGDAHRSRRHIAVVEHERE
jgi:hypothetical protein